jgi:hypothetical protein
MDLSRLTAWAHNVLGGRGARRQRSRPGSRIRLLLECLESRLTPSDVSWSGAGDNASWSDARNWSTGQLPGSSDDVTIDSPATTVVHASGSDAVHSLQSNKPITMSGGSLSFATDSAIAATLQLSGGTLTSAGGLTLNGLSQSGGTLNGTGAVTIQDQWTWSGGTQSDAGTTVLNGTADISGGFFAELNGRTVDNHGTATLGTSSGFEFFYSGTWNNHTDGTLVFQSGSSVDNFFADSAQINNDGLVKLVGGTGHIDVTLNTSATGTVDVASNATMTLTTGSCSGTFSIASGATLSVGAWPYPAFALKDGATSTGAGKIQVSTFNSATVSGSVTLENLAIIGGTLTVNTSGSLTVTDLKLDSGGTLTGAGDVTVTDNFDWVRGTLSGAGNTTLQGTSTLRGGFFSVLNARGVDNDGTATVASSDGITFEGNAVWNNQSDGTVVLESGSSLDKFFSDGSKFNNAGVLTVNSGSGNIAFAVTNTGTVTVLAGRTLSVGGNFTQTDGNTTVDGTLTVSNTVYLNGGVLHGSGTINGNVVNAAELDPGESPGILTINGNYTQTAAGTLVIEIGGPDAGTGYDRLVVNGVAALAGTLSVTILNNYVPDSNAVFQVLTFHSHTGDFDAYAGLDLGTGQSLTPEYGGGDSFLSLVIT